MEPRTRVNQLLPSLHKSLMSSDVMLQFYTPDGSTGLVETRHIVGIAPAAHLRADGVARFNVLVTIVGIFPTCHSVEQLRDLLFPMEVE